MNAPEQNSWSEASRLALTAALARIRRVLENAGGCETRADEDSARDDDLEPWASDLLCERLDLSAFERDLLLLCAGMELEPDFADLCARAQGDERRAFPTFGLAFGTLPGAHWSALSPQGPLHHWHLLEIAEGEPKMWARLAIDERILLFLLGIPAWDRRLVSLLYPLDSGRGLPPSQLARAERLCRLWTRATDGLPIVSMHGEDSAGARAVATRACADLGLQPLGLRADELPDSAEERALLATLLVRECALGAGALVIETGEAPRRLAAFLERLACPVILLGSAPADLRLLHSSLEIRKPRHEEQLAQWSESLADYPVGDGRMAALISHFDFSTADIEAAAAEARLDLDSCTAAESAPNRASVLWDICRRRARSGMEDLAQRIRPRACWDDLVVPPVQRAMLEDITRQVRHRATVYQDWGFAARGGRGLGISALFAGESGTGKTMAAEVLAGDLELDLYRIDLSAVVSKYIGETEKNLARVFAAAETSGAVLLFDEADALFGKRSDVKDSHDRYANVELAYLLQRMEAYRGLAILTTNLKSLLDGAFLRRIRFVVQFPFPDLGQRAEIWRRIFPESLPRGEIRVDQLSRLHLAGGYIRNIALNAAFLAADEAAPLTMGHLARAARMEFAKLERPLSEAELGGWS